MISTRRAFFSCESASAHQHVDFLQINESPSAGDLEDSQATIASTDYCVFFFPSLPTSFFSSPPVPFFLINKRSCHDKRRICTHAHPHDRQDAAHLSQTVTIQPGFLVLLGRRPGGLPPMSLLAPIAIVSATLPSLCNTTLRWIARRAPLLPPSIMR